MSAERYTVETLASGQPRPYAEHIRHVRVTFEKTPWDGSSKELQPTFCSEEYAIMRLKGMACGFPAKPKAEADWYDTRLDWIKPVDGKPASEVIPRGDPKQIVASTWEFHTTTAFTD